MRRPKAKGTWRLIDDPSAPLQQATLYFCQKILISMQLAAEGHLFKAGRVFEEADSWANEITNGYQMSRASDIQEVFEDFLRQVMRV